MDCNNSPLFISSFLALERKSVFFFSIRKHLERITGKKPDSNIFYDRNAFTDLLKQLLSTKATHLRIHFACYDHLPATSAAYAENELLIQESGDDRDRTNLLTVIYQSVNRKGNKDDPATMGKYSFIHEKRGLISDLNPEIAEHWITHWKDDKRIALAREMSMENDAQTRSILFDLKDHIRLLKEQLECWAKHFTGVTLHFAQYKVNETVDGKAVGNQLTLIFFCENDFPFLLFGTKKFLEQVKEYEIKLLGGNNNDTGSPCPPNANCP